ncbi:MULTISPECIES: cation:proton antiporter [Sphingomonas]|jgi:Kef-type K+ transport system membrane component KefB|uniref:Potassium transporter n=1 Tax=Sphingomonas hankookensis TaxID=563996 RepID=A0ABR5YGF1_9SPHN|nr:MULTISPECIES: cation:proton antiporter [Sphingomonas]KZE18327.1 potassium transporter [Sphingomonas hankookensis]PZT95678.1 MAG: cation/H(+) antiporter [Sphingomonas sp.]RSV26419.1 cation:proton antiporter [Sphingomonas sp. ABOLH]WCP73033.1 cation:proton antiporter [Sphingomonas hankookensis]
MVNEMVAALGDVLNPHGPAVQAAKSYAPSDYSIHFFLQLAVILLACRVVGWAGKRFLNQPQVVGEMIAGVVLGPSLLGLFFPDLQAAIFPKETRGLLYAGAQLGVGLYMFLVGLTLRLDHFQTKAKSAAMVSAAGIAMPFLLAVLVTPMLLTVPGLFAEGISTGSATLFMGACIALTAFPMLARIIHERGLADTALGTLSLTAGAFDDAVSWCVLAIVLATFGAGAGVAIVAIGGAVLYAAFLILFGKQLLAPLGRAVEAKGEMSMTVLSITLMLFCLSAFFMDAIGIHAIFGGFILGVFMPRGLFVEELKRKVEPLAVVLLLPMFFTYSGLNTRMDTVSSLPLLLIALGILTVSILAKFGACWAAARIAGEDNRTALGIGALMNSRGLMELIIINIGLQKGIIGPTLFAMLVLMAIVTTVMATPLFEAVYGKRARASGELGGVPA